MTTDNDLENLYGRDDHDIDNLTEGKGYDFGAVVEAGTPIPGAPIFREHPETGEKRRVVSRPREMRPNDWGGSSHYSGPNSPSDIVAAGYDSFTAAASVDSFRLLGEDPYRLSATLVNTGDGDVYIGTQRAVNARQGYILPSSGTSGALTTHTTQEVWCRRVADIDSQVSVWVERRAI